MRLAHWFALWAVNAEHDVAALNATAPASAASATAAGGGSKQGRTKRSGGGGGGGGAGGAIVPAAASELRLLGNEDGVGGRKACTGGEPAVTLLRGVAALVSRAVRPERCRVGGVGSAHACSLAAGRGVQRSSPHAHAPASHASHNRPRLLQVQLLGEVCGVVEGVQAALPPANEDWQQAAARTKASCGCGCVGACLLAAPPNRDWQQVAACPKVWF